MSRQWNIGELIAKLDELDGAKDVLCGGYRSDNMTGFGSYRGIYSELAIYTDQPCECLTVDKLRNGLRNAIDTKQVFTGYKGGTYVYDNDTKVWIAESSNSGVALHGIHELRSYVVLTSTDEWWFS